MATRRRASEPGRSEVSSKRRSLLPSGEPLGVSAAEQGPIKLPFPPARYTTSTGAVQGSWYLQVHIASFFFFLSCGRHHSVRVLDRDTECPPQVCQLSRSSDSTHFLNLRRDAALFDSIRAPDGFCDRTLVPPIYSLTIPNTKRQPYHTKPIQMISIRIITGLSRPYLNKSLAAFYKLT